MASEKRTIQTSNDGETRNLGIEIGRTARSGTVVELHGSLGTGKTVLARGIAQGLGVRQWRGSPTFNLVHEYEGRLPLFHLDAYRITSGELVDLDLDRMVEAEGVIVVEWAENVSEALLPIPVANRVSITISDLGMDSREIDISQ